MRTLSFILMVLAVAPSPRPLQAQECERALGEAYLDEGNVRARLFNNGQLFWRGSPHVYEVPKGGGVQALFTSSIWLGGLVNNELRFAGSTYGPQEFWAGPLTDDGTAPADCDRFDRIWRVSRKDVLGYEELGVATSDLADWPTGLGAPTLDAEGNAIDLTWAPLALRMDRKIDLEAGERPDITGDQMLWWIMNDLGGEHLRFDRPALGVEIQASAFAFDAPGVLGNTTFYRWRIEKPVGPPVEDAYFGMFQDPDMGNFDDDYVGSDSLLGMAYTYNADNDDEGGAGYGEAPPAVGLDFVDGPVADSDGRDNDFDGVIDEPGERVQLSSFMFYHGGSGVTGDPRDGEQAYNYLRGRWKDDRPVTWGGNGYDFSESPTPFMYSGNPPAAWSEFDSGDGVARAPSDRRFIASAGRFVILPGEPVEFMAAIVTSFGSDNLDSVYRLKAENALVQDMVDAGFPRPEGPEAPDLYSTTLPGGLLLSWENPPGSNNIAEGFSAPDPLVPGAGYRFEGYVLSMRGPGEDRSRVIAIYDLDNDVQRLEVRGRTVVVGNDRGIRHQHFVEGLTDYTAYEFGIQAYAYGPDAWEPVLFGPVRTLTVVPARGQVELSEESVGLALSASDSIATVTGSISAVPAPENLGSASLAANVLDPARVTGSDYDVEFLGMNPGSAEVDIETGRGGQDPPLIQNPLRERCDAPFQVIRSDGLVRATGTGSTGLPGGQVVDLVQFDGLSLNLSRERADFLDFAVVANAAGPLAEPDGASADWAGFPGLGRPTPGEQQVQEGVRGFIVHAGAAGRSYEAFLDRLYRGGCAAASPHDFELRFTAQGSSGLEMSTPGSPAIVALPFELWNIGIGTPDDSSDDFRMIPAVIDWDGDGWSMQAVDHIASGGANDPESDWIYWYEPDDTAPGAGGYETWLGSLGTGGDPLKWLGREVMARMVLVSWNGGDVREPAPPGGFAPPEVGTVFRIGTTKPPQPGDRFTLSTRGFQPRALSRDERRAELERIGISPNPFLHQSSYQAGEVPRVRFTGLPERATVRVFTLSGSLVHTVRHDGPSRHMDWDLQTDAGRPLAGGIYLVHVETDAGGRVFKFSLVRRR